MTNIQCAAAHPCEDDSDEPCFCPFIGPRRRECLVIPSVAVLLACYPEAGAS